MKAKRVPLTETVMTRVRPLERRALEQLAAENDTTLSAAARQAILRGLQTKGSE